MTDLTHLRQPYTLGDNDLENRAVMAPLTRSRAIGNLPNALMAEYYAQRAAAGLIITEGTSPSPNGLGYPRIPGVFSVEQVAGWRLVTEAVHANGGKIFVQLMHTGRVTHPLNLPDGAEALAPSAIAVDEKMYTDQEGEQPCPPPREMTEEDIEHAIQEYVAAARHAIDAGFDGVELHGANGYLIEQFLNPSANQREDGWGGSAEARNRFALEVAQRTADAIGAGRVGMRLSPYGVFNSIQGDYDGLDAQYEALAKELGAIGLVYLHLVDHSPMGTPEVPAAIKRSIREVFPNTLILSGGYDGERAEEDLAAGHGDLIAFGRPFLANPDLLTRYERDAELNAPRQDLFYTPGPEGYTDYTVLDA